MTVLQSMTKHPSCAAARLIASYICEYECPSHSMTCHPSAFQRSGMFTGITSSMRPLICMSFQSTSTVRLLSFSFAAILLASATCPFTCSPSPITTHVLEFDPRALAASAKPTPAARPCPRLPVPQSTPGTSLSTCPWKGLQVRLKFEYISSGLKNPYAASAE